jgi:hypothetical protein
MSAFQELRKCYKNPTAEIANTQHFSTLLEWALPFLEGNNDVKLADSLGRNIAGRHSGCGMG